MTKNPLTIAEQNYIFCTPECGTIGRMLTCYVDLTGTKFAKYHHKNKFTVIIII
jgi:hypothetical protein